MCGRRIFMATALAMCGRQILRGLRFPKIFFRKKIMPPREFDANLLFFTALGGEGRDGVAVRVEQADVRLCPRFPQVPYAVYI